MRKNQQWQSYPVPLGLGFLVRVQVVKCFKEKISWYEDAFSNK